MAIKWSVRLTSFILLFVPVLALAQGSRSVSVQGGQPFTADFPDGGRIRMNLRSAGVTITGGAENKILVRFSAPNSDDLKDVRVSLKTNGKQGDLEITGGPRNNFEMYIQIPRNSGLYTRMFAGELDIRGIEGNKDLEIHFGEMNVKLDHPADYGPVQASVTSGDLEAPAFNVSKGGLFRSFQTNNAPHTNSPGKYTLYAHVGAGQLNLE